jgi:hypothetical protein
MNDIELIQKLTALELRISALETEFALMRAQSEATVS